MLSKFLETVRATYSNLLKNNKTAEDRLEHFQDDSKIAQLNLNKNFYHLEIIQRELCVIRVTTFSLLDTKCFLVCSKIAFPDNIFIIVYFWKL